ncbi:MAG: hypothetical protein JXB00_18825 [Bacteroidales bacterium]|nr:hypothetical protein [Bacteroidales bacterium]
MKRITILLTALMLVFFGCTKDEDKNGSDDDGYENMSGFKETCTPSSFPGLEIAIDGNYFSETEIDEQAYEAYANCVSECYSNPDNQTECAMNCLSLLGIVQTSGAFSLTVYITNTTEETITYIVEPGDWFQPGSGDYQPMLSAVHITKVVQPGETITIAIPVFCLASHLSAPDEISEYTMCEMINSNTCLAGIIDILKTKDTELFTGLETSTIQDIIWSCTEGEEVDWDFLNNLPDKE